MYSLCCVHLHTLVYTCRHPYAPYEDSHVQHNSSKQQIPKNYKLLAVPLFELYDNLHRYGPVVAAIPTMISRYRLTLGAASIAVPRVMPDPQVQQEGQQYAQQQMVAYQQY